MPNRQRSPNSTPINPDEPPTPLQQRAMASRAEYERLMAEAKQDFDRITTQHVAARARGQKAAKPAAVETPEATETPAAS